MKTLKKVGLMALSILIFWLILNFAKFTVWMSVLPYSVGLRTLAIVTVLTVLYVGYRAIRQKFSDFLSLFF
jgi:hypothetical protein